MLTIRRPSEPAQTSFAAPLNGLIATLPAQNCAGAKRRAEPPYKGQNLVPMMWRINRTVLRPCHQQKHSGQLPRELSLQRAKSIQTKRLESRLGHELDELAAA